jgi:hypothetical protein
VSWPAGAGRGDPEATAWLALGQSTQQLLLLFVEQIIIYDKDATMSNPNTTIRITLLAELATIRAQMQAIETTLPAGQCPIQATDALYGQQEAIKQLLAAMD